MRTPSDEHPRPGFRDFCQLVDNFDEFASLRVSRSTLTARHLHEFSLYRLRPVLLRQRVRDAVRHARAIDRGDRIRHRQPIRHATPRRHASVLRSLWLESGTRFRRRVGRARLDLRCDARCATTSSISRCASAPDGQRMRRPAWRGSAGTDRPASQGGRQNSSARCNIRWSRTTFQRRPRRCGSLRPPMPSCWRCWRPGTRSRRWCRQGGLVAALSCPALPSDVRVLRPSGAAGPPPPRCDRAGGGNTVAGTRLPLSQRPSRGRARRSRGR